MHKGKYVFSQLLDFIDKDVFLRIANRYEGNRYVKNFTCWNQLAVMMFGQLSNRESLRDVVLATQALSDKAYHLGFGRYASRSTLADANNKRDYHNFEEFAYRVVADAASAGRPTSSSLAGTYMPLTFAWRHSNGPSSGSTSGKAESKYIHCTTSWKPPFQRSSTSRKPGSMT